MRLSEKLKSLVTGFVGDKAGNFAVMMSVLALPIFGSIALAVDYSNLMRQRGAIQSSLDAAALAASKEYSTGMPVSALEAYAFDYFESNLPPYLNLQKIDFDFAIKTTPKTGADGQTFQEKSVALDARLHYDTYLARVVGVNEIAADIASEVAMGNITVEIALVIDNSGSMDTNGRIGLAKSTSKKLVNTIFNAAGVSNKQDPVKFALVPFAASVNVGKSYATAKWMDTKGWAPIHNENLDWTTYVRPSNSQSFEKQDKGTHFVYREKIANTWKWKTRFDVFDMLGIDWKGCVEMRPWPHNARDTHQMIDTSDFNAAKNGYAGGDGLDAIFVPLFAPAEPSSTYARVKNGKTSHSSDSYNYTNDYLYDWMRPKSSNPSQLEQIYYNTSFPSPYNNGVSGSGSKQNLRQDWVWRYQAAALDPDNITTSIGANATYGPNYHCTTAAVKPLTTSKSEIETAINSMVADGNTNIQEGVGWGWRLVSSREPFTEGRVENDGENRKYLIVLTDGNNTYGTSSTPNDTIWGAWGYGKHGRMDAGLTTADRPELYKNVSLNTEEKKMNAHTLQTCENARVDGITIFAIAFDVANGSSVKQLLDACAGPGIVDGKPLAANGQFYFDVNGKGLEDAMADIAAQISDMRISR